jgi:hypothetical protein
MLALGRLRQEDYKFKVRLGYIERPCLKKKRKRKDGRKEEYFWMKTGNYLPFIITYTR